MKQMDSHEFIGIILYKIVTDEYWQLKGEKKPIRNYKQYKLYFSKLITEQYK